MVTCDPTGSVGDTKVSMAEGGTSCASESTLNYLVTYMCHMQAGLKLVFFDPSDSITVTVPEGSERREGGSRGGRR